MERRTYLISFALIVAVAVIGYFTCTDGSAPDCASGVKSLDDIDCCPGGAGTDAVVVESFPHQLVLREPSQQENRLKDFPGIDTSEAVTFCPCDSTIILVDSSLATMNAEDQEALARAKDKGEANYIFELPGATDFDNSFWAVVERDSITDEPPVHVAILDSGLDEDLMGDKPGQIITTLSMFEGFIPDVHDDYGHGSLVFKIIDDLNSDELEYSIYKCLNEDGVGSSFTLACALKCAAEERVEIINVSLGAYVDARIVRSVIDEIEYSAIIASKGNDCTDTEASPHYPSDYTNVFDVLAFDEPGSEAFDTADDVPELWDCTNGQGDREMIAAPARITSAHGEVGNGTSFAAAHLTGVFASHLTETEALPTTSNCPALLQDWINTDGISAERYLYATESCIEVKVVR